MLAKFERPTSRLLTLTNSRSIFCQVDTLGSETNCLQGSEPPATGYSSQRRIAVRKVTDSVSKKDGEGRVWVFLIFNFAENISQFQFTASVSRIYKHGKHGSVDQGL